MASIWYWLGTWLICDWYLVANWVLPGCFLVAFKLDANSLQTGCKLVGLLQQNSLHSNITRYLKQYRYATFRWFPPYPPNVTLFIMAHSLPNPSQPIAKKAPYNQTNSPWSNTTAMLPSGGSPLTLLTLRYPTAGIRSRKYHRKQFHNLFETGAGTCCALPSMPRRRGGRAAHGCLAAFRAVLLPRGQCPAMVTVQSSAPIARTSRGPPPVKRGASFAL